MRYSTPQTSRSRSTKLYWILHVLQCKTETFPMWTTAEALGWKPLCLCLQIWWYRVWPTAILQYAKNSSPTLSKVAVAFTGALSMVLGNFADSHLPVSFFVGKRHWKSNDNALRSKNPWVRNKILKKHRVTYENLRSTSGPTLSHVPFNRCFLQLLWSLWTSCTLSP